VILAILGLFFWRFWGDGGFFWLRCCGSDVSISRDIFKISGHSDGAGNNAGKFFHGVNE
jgi:hypothetical protein